VIDVWEITTERSPDAFAQFRATPAVPAIPAVKVRALLH